VYNALESKQKWMLSSAIVCRKFLVVDGNQITPKQLKAVVFIWWVRIGAWHTIY